MSKNFAVNTDRLKKKKKTNENSFILIFIRDINKTLGLSVNALDHNP